MDMISIYQYFISFISMYQYIKFPWPIDIYRLSTILDWPTGPGPTSSCPSMTARCKAVTPLGPLPRGSARAVTRAWPRVDGDVPTGKVKHIIDSMNIIIYTYICINININIYISWWKVCGFASVLLISQYFSCVYFPNPSKRNHVLLLIVRKCLVKSILDHHSVLRDETLKEQTTEFLVSRSKHDQRPHKSIRQHLSRAGT